MMSHEDPAPGFTAASVAREFEAICPRGSGIQGDEEGFVFGDPETLVSGVACVWSVDAASLKKCMDRGLNMIVSHESIWLPVWESKWYSAPGAERIEPHRIRRE